MTAEFMSMTPSVYSRRTVGQYFEVRYSSTAVYTAKRYLNLGKYMGTRKYRSKIVQLYEYGCISALYSCILPLNNIPLLSTLLLDVSLARNAPGPGHSKSDFNSPLLFVCGTERPSLPPIIIPRARVSRT